MTRGGGYYILTGRTEAIIINILFLINFAGKGGTEKYVENLVRIFSGGGHKCHLCYNIDGPLAEKLLAAGVSTLKLDMSRSKAPAAARALAEYCRASGIDVIHAQYPRENIIALMAAKRVPGLKVVYTNHLTIHSGLRWRILNKIFTPRDYKIIAVCREGRDIMISNGVCPDRIEVIYNGVEPAGESVRDLSVRAALGVPENAFMMVILARYEEEKGLPFLLESLDRLRALTDRRFTCVICGDGSRLEELKAQTTAMGLDDCVLHAGFRSDTAQILHGADLYLNSSSKNEAMSFAILEAMNAGLPLVVTDVGGNRDLAETNTVCGTVVDYGNTEGFARAVLTLMDNDALRAEYSRAAVKKVAEEFDLNKLAWDVFRAYQ